MKRDVILKKKLIGGFDRRQVMEYICQLQAQCSDKTMSDEIEQTKAQISLLTSVLDEKNKKIDELNNEISLAKNDAEPVPGAETYFDVLKLSEDKIKSAKALASEIGESFGSSLKANDDKIDSLYHRLEKINDEIDLLGSSLDTLTDRFSKFSSDNSDALFPDEISAEAEENIAESEIEEELKIEEESEVEEEPETNDEVITETAEEPITEFASEVDTEPSDDGDSEADSGKKDDKIDAIYLKLEKIGAEIDTLETELSSLEDKIAPLETEKAIAPEENDFETADSFGEANEQEHAKEPETVQSSPAKKKKKKKGRTPYNKKDNPTQNQNTNSSNKPPKGSDGDEKTIEDNDCYFTLEY